MNQAVNTPLTWNEKATNALLPHNLDGPTKGSLIVVVIMFLFSIVTYFYNKMHGSYSFAATEPQFLRDFIGVWIMYRFSTLIKYDRIRRLISAICFTVFCFIASFMAANAISGTPSLHLLNWSLLAADVKLGFNQVALLNWTFQHPWLVSILHFAYNSWAPQFIIVPIALALFARSVHIAEWTYATLLALVIGGLIYFFFPSSSPASVLVSPYLPGSSYVCIAHFYGAHHALGIDANGCGLIDFPSFHVIDAVLNTLALRRVKVLGIIMLILNLLMIASTLMLGYHFLVDVIAGTAIAFFTYYVAQSSAK